MTRHLSHLRIDARYSDDKPDAVDVEIIVQDEPMLAQDVSLDLLPTVFEAVLSPGSAEPTIIFAPNHSGMSAARIAYEYTRFKPDIRDYK